MSAMPRIEDQYPQQEAQPQPELSVHRAGGETADNKNVVAGATAHLTAMLICCGAFAIGFVAFVVVPSMRAWLAL